MSEWAIEACGLTKRFGDFAAVSGLDLKVKKGSIYGFLGPNGCGKTTAIRLLTGLLAASEGEAKLFGQSVLQNSDQLKSKIGYMTQKFSLFDDLTVRENLHFVASIYGLSRAERRQRIDQLMTDYDLTERADNFAGSMSGGQRQRLALAAATIHRPPLLFLDEPTSAVDPENRRDFWEKLFDLCDSGTTILVSTHYMDEAERCHQLAILEAGIKRVDGSPQRLMDEMSANVVEVSGSDLRGVKRALELNPMIQSSAQLGAHLRVLVDKKEADPLQWMTKHYPQLENRVVLARPSLEDVFVNCTGGSGSRQ
ncbi:ABC transporter ATP-binding protein [Umboniibacter marinipuniceus]|uniref:ABC-2 type transport system ATP-binding protein n=1 Tax=Umboniibacter marinipuniceus TaxID=569599 RepID=A0A3M0ADE8_9GAMM|nr:ABC transporter ATP-binding protein [Umboniibacter marinipuniceus]RMA82556.1 ABC-2 type transport system ATP-binding protein [Umboniibacter marinipuniceus]